MTFNFCLTFSGSEAVDSLVVHLALSDREEAVKLGQLLMERSVFRHVTGKLKM